LNDIILRRVERATGDSGRRTGEHRGCASECAVRGDRASSVLLKGWGIRVNSNQSEAFGHDGYVGLCFWLLRSRRILTMATIAKGYVVMVRNRTHTIII
jgi:hypothetical protein